MDPNEASKCSSPSAESKENLSISEDERDIIDGTEFLGGQRFSMRQTGHSPNRNRTMELRRSDVQVISPTTAILLRENNQVLCPLSRNEPLRRFRRSFATLTFVSPNGEFEDETASFVTAQTKAMDEEGGRIICTCCTQCKFCHRLSSFGQRNCIDAATQTDLHGVKMEENEPGKPLGFKKSIKANDTKADFVASKVVCTYLANASDEFYPLSRAESRHRGQVSEDQPETEVPPVTEIPVSPTSISHGMKPRRLPFKTKRSRSATNLDSSELFLRYLKLLILRQKEKFSPEFWSAYASDFDSPLCMTPEEVETCRRRFGDGYDVDQLERMFPSALKSSNGDWRRQMQRKSDVSAHLSRYNQRSQTTTLKTPTNQFVRIDRADQFRSVQAKGAKKAHNASLRLTSSSPTSAVQNTGMSTASKLRPVKLNRAAILRADAIFYKYWVTP